MSRVDGETGAKGFGVFLKARRESQALIIETRCRGDGHFVHSQPRKMTPQSAWRGTSTPLTFGCTLPVGQWTHQPFHFFLVCTVVFRHRNTWTSHRIRSWVTWPPRLTALHQTIHLPLLPFANARQQKDECKGGKKTVWQLGRWGRGNRPQELRFAEPWRNSAFVPLKGGRL